MSSKVANTSISEPFIYTPALLVSPSFYLGPHHVENAALVLFLS